MLFKYSDWFSFDASYGTLQFHLLHNKNHWSYTFSFISHQRLNKRCKTDTEHTHTHTHTLFFHVCAVLYSKSSKSFSDVIFSCLEKSSLIKFLHSCLAENIEKAIHKSYILKVNNLIYIVLLSTRICFDKTVFTWINCTASVWFPR